MIDIDFQKLFCDVTGLTWDVKKLINKATTKEARKALLKKLVWMIPDGAHPDITTHKSAIDTPSVKTPRIILTEEIATRLQFTNLKDLSEVFKDFNKDTDVDAYDAVTVDDGNDGSTPVEKYTLNISKWSSAGHVQYPEAALITTDKSEYAAGDEVVLTISANTGFTLEHLEVIPNEGSSFDVSVETPIFTMPASNVMLNAYFSVEIQPEAETYSVDIFMGSGSGYDEYKMLPRTVTGDGTIFQTDAGTVTISKSEYEADENVVLNISINEGYTLGGELTVGTVGDDVEYIMVDSEHPQFTMPASDVIVWLPIGEEEQPEPEPTYTLNISKVSSNGDPIEDNDGFPQNPGTITAENEYEAGDTVVLQISVTEGYALQRLEVRPNEGVSFDVDDITHPQFTMPESDVTLYAYFHRERYTINISMLSKDGDDINGNPATIDTNEGYDGFAFGDTVVLSISTNEGYELDRIEGVTDNGDVFNVDIYELEFTMPSSDVELTVYFSEPTYSVYISKRSAGGCEIQSYPGTIETEKDEYKFGEDVVLEIDVNEGYTLEELWGEPDVGSSFRIDIDNPQFTMPASDVRIKAYFQEPE